MLFSHWLSCVSVAREMLSCDKFLLRNAFVGGFTTIKLTKEERKPFPEGRLTHLSLSLNGRLNLPPSGSPYPMKSTGGGYLGAPLFFPHAPFLIPYLPSSFPPSIPLSHLEGLPPLSSLRKSGNHSPEGRLTHLSSPHHRVNARPPQADVLPVYPAKTTGGGYHGAPPCFLSLSNSLPPSLPFALVDGHMLTLDGALRLFFRGC